mgnify:CR=1 FL=1
MDDIPEPPRRQLRQWQISEIDFRGALQRAHDGEDPEFLFIEYYGNASNHRLVDG